MEQQNSYEDEINLLKGFPLDFSVDITHTSRLILTGVLSFGGFGITYKGLYFNQKDSTGSTNVVVKEFFPRGLCQRSNEGNRVIPGGPKFAHYKNKFITEAERLIELHQIAKEDPMKYATLTPLKHIVKALHRFEHNGTHYYIMEKAPGMDLFKYIAKKGPLRLDEALRILYKIMDALEYLHDRHIFHLDITPGNIIYSEEDDMATLIDFGLSRAEEDGSINLSTSNQPFTMFYAARELIENKEGMDYITIDQRADIYSLAAVLYFMVTGLQPDTYSSLEFGLYWPYYADSRTLHILKDAMRIKRGSRTNSIKKFRELCNKAKVEKLCCRYDPTLTPDKLWNRKSSDVLNSVGYCVMGLTDQNAGHIIREVDPSERERIIGGGIIDIAENEQNATISDPYENEYKDNGTAISELEKGLEAGGGQEGKTALSNLEMEKAKNPGPAHMGTASNNIGGEKQDPPVSDRNDPVKAGSQKGGDQQQEPSKSGGDSTASTGSGQGQSPSTPGSGKADPAGGKQGHHSPTPGLNNSGSGSSDNGKDQGQDVLTPGTGSEKETGNPTEKNKKEKWETPDWAKALLLILAVACVAFAIYKFVDKEEGEEKIKIEFVTQDPEPEPTPDPEPEPEPEIPNYTPEDVHNMFIDLKDGLIDKEELSTYFTDKAYYRIRMSSGEWTGYSEDPNTRVFLLIEGLNNVKIPETHKVTNVKMKDGKILNLELVEVE